jgi:PadR family transcriptional regulator PadR
MRMTLQTLRVLDALLDHGARYGYELMKLADLRSGTLYPILRRLEAAGWVTSGWVPPDEPGTPPRRYYRLTELGRAEAERHLAAAPRR